MSKNDLNKIKTLKNLRQSLRSLTIAGVECQGLVEDIKRISKEVQEIYSKAK